MSINHIINELKEKFGKSKINIAELGVFRGESIPILFNNLNVENYYGIDLYVDSDDSVLSYGIHKNNNSTANKNYLKIIETYKNNNKVNIIKKNTNNASKIFDDSFFDLIFIDAGHDYVSVYEDIRNWFPKLKKGGIICGDDLHTPSVEKAVIDFFKDKYKIHYSKNKNPYTRKKNMTEFNNFNMNTPRNILGIYTDKNGKGIVGDEKRPYSWLVYK